MTQVGTRPRNPFRAGTVLAVLAIGVVAFLLMLYAIGQGWTGTEERNGGEHATSTGLPGFKGLYDLLDNQDYNVRLSRTPGGYQDYGLLVLTPPRFTSPDQVTEVLEQRLEFDSGPTMLILPKWWAYEVPESVRSEIEAEDGWVILDSAQTVPWFDDLEFAEGAELAVGETRSWNGLGKRGSLPNREQAQALVTQPATDTSFIARVTDSEGDLLVGEIEDPSALYADDNFGYYSETYPFIIVFEPDLMNNYGLENRERAELAMALIQSSTELDPNMPIIFDMTLPGLGASENLLTLAFSPPFLAATLCLLVAGFVIAWRSFNRFGPPVAEAPTRTQGKRQLARNGASLVARVKRFHLLADPYANLMSKRIGDALGVRETSPETRALAIDRALERRGFEGPSFLARTNDLRAADNPKDIMRAANALKDIERMLKQ